jgi:hypothetical protein
LDKKPIILPRDKKYYPRMDGLEWRFKRLTDSKGLVGMKMQKGDFEKFFNNV